MGKIRDPYRILVGKLVRQPPFEIHDMRMKCTKLIEKLTVRHSGERGMSLLHTEIYIRVITYRVDFLFIT